MTVSNQCQRCGGRLPKSDVLAGGCPRCMLELGYETESHSATAAATGALPASIGRYRILRVIGGGGMGIVYEAEQEQPRRTVALKIIKHGMTNPELLWRFELETEALGRLQHPGIAQIYDAGTVDTGFGPQPYFAMELIRGQQPREFAESHNMDTRQRIELMIKICDAVHHAHQRGLIHRDLKPANILVDEAGQPKILDFGVVRATDSDTRSTTDVEIGRLIGTLPYMSPEQASADPLELDTRTDVYSLGIIFYELLTGHLPYTVSRKIPEAIQTILENDPEKISAVNRSYRGDIETIVSTALEKDKTRRYQSAFGFAMDLRRFLNDEPIAALPPNVGYQLRKFTRRHKALVGGVAVVFIVLVAGVTATSWYAVQAKRAERLLAGASVMLKTERDFAVEAGRTAIAAEGKAQQDRDRADTEAAASKTQRLITIFQSLAQESIRYSSNRLDDDRAALLARQAMLFHAHLPNQARYLVEDALQQASRLAPINHNMLPRDKSGFNAIAYSLDGRYLAAGGDDNTVRLWDRQNPGISPRLLSGQVGQAEHISSLAFSHDGTLLAVGSDLRGRSIQIWDLRNLKAPLKTLPYKTAALSLAFSPDGGQLVAGGTDPSGVAVWNLKDSGVPIMLFKSAQDIAQVNSVAFSPSNGALVAAASGDKVWIWDLEEPQTERLSFTAKPGSAPKNPLPTAISANSVIQSATAAFRSLAFSRDGSYLAAGGSIAIQIWDLRNPRAAPMQLPIPGEGSILADVKAITYSADDSYLAAAAGNSLWVWNLHNTNVRSREQFQLDSEVNSAMYSPDGVSLAAASAIGVRVLENAVPRISPNYINRPFLAYSANIGRVAVATDSTLEVRDLGNPSARPLVLGGLHGPLRHRSSRNNSMTFSADGSRLTAVSGEDLLLWDLRSPEDPPLVLAKFNGFYSVNVAFSHDGTRLAAASILDGLRIWDLRSLHTEPDLIRQSRVRLDCRSLAFSPNGEFLAIGTATSVQIWDLRHPTMLPLESPNLGVPQDYLVFSPDSAKVASTSSISSTSTTVRIWDASDLRTPVFLLGSDVHAISLAFSHDGMRLAAGVSSPDDMAQMWDLRKPTAAPISFSDSNMLVGSTGEAIAFSNDGSRLVFGDIMGKIHTWPLWSAAANNLCTRIWRNLTMEEWLQYVGEGIPYERTCPALPPGVGAPGAPR